MSTLIVLLPPREPTLSLQEWLWPELPFALIDKNGHTQRTGRAAFALLPRALSTVLVVAARDLLLIATSVPPLKGPRLRQALPNIVEDQLIQDPQTCHIAIDPVALDDGRRVLAVIDRAWFHFIHEAFKSTGHRHLRAVPATRCLPLPSAEENPAGVEEITRQTPEPRETIVAAALGLTESTVAAAFAEGVALITPMPAVQRVELALARGRLGEGFAAPVTTTPATLAALAGDSAMTLYELTTPSNEPELALEGQHDATRLLPSAVPLSFDTFARHARTERFDLCQFEFEAQPWRFNRATFKRLRIPLWLGVAALAVALIGANLHWWKLTRQRDALTEQITATLLSAFPKTTTVLDAPTQMSRQLDQLRIAAGELSPSDFLSLASALSRSLAPLPENGIASLDYQERQLSVGFKHGLKADAEFNQRLARNGLSGSIDTDTGKWIIRSGT